MLIDYTQEKDGPVVSYVDKNNQITVEQIILEEGYYNYVECYPTDPNRLENIVSFTGLPIRKESGKRFSFHNINEFFSTDVPKNYPEHYKKFSELREPNPFSIDLEILPTEKYGYSNVNDVENPITSISITDQNLNSILFCVKNSRKKLNDFDNIAIKAYIDEALGVHATKYAYDFSIREFDTEIEMLNAFLECVNKYFHLIMGWNFLLFDWQYIFNRSVKLGIDPKKASPTKRSIKKKIKINDATEVELQLPSHRIIADYMFLFKESLIYNNLGNYSLDAIAELILGLNKVSYSGNLLTLYNTNYNKFLAYAFIDTILVMLIHKATNLLTVEFFQSYYNNVPFQKLSQNSISEALVFNDLKLRGQFLLETEKTHNTYRKYVGGYVKNPTKKIIGSCMGEDFKALYPNSIITIGISPEMKIDSIKTNELGLPATIEDTLVWNKYKAMGYTLAPMGRIYNGTEDGLYVRIEKRLLNERSIYQSHMMDIFLNIIPLIEKELTKFETK
jgi:DNA polymerase elongation subunit (family B)